MNGGNFNLNMMALADTGQWRLIVTVSYNGISAILKNVMYPGVEPLPLFTKEWVATEADLLEKIEEAVYDNPRLLDDFATQILIYTSRSLWIPAEFTEDEEYDSNFFTAIYPVNPEDIFADFSDSEVCLYSIAPGVNSFFRRTLPGCKVASHITILKREFQRIETESSTLFSEKKPFSTVYINCRKNDVDFLAFSNGRFLSASTHQWISFDDITYHALLLCRVYGLQTEEVRLVLSGAETLTTGLKNTVSDFFLNVISAKLPTVFENFNLPLAAAIAAGENISLK